MQIVTECQAIFNFRLPSVIIPDRGVRHFALSTSLAIACPVSVVTFAAFVISMHYLQFIS